MVSVRLTVCRISQRLQARRAVVGCFMLCRTVSPTRAITLINLRCVTGTASRLPASVHNVTFRPVRFDRFAGCHLLKLYIMNLSDVLKIALPLVGFFAVIAVVVWVLGGWGLLLLSVVVGALVR